MKRMLSLLLTLALLLSCFTIVGSRLSVSAADELMVEDILAAAEAYVQKKLNTVTGEGLLAAVQSVASTVTMDTTADFFVKHAVPGAYDNDTTYPLSIPGSDGAVVAFFGLGGERIGFVSTFEHTETEIVTQKTAVVGTDADFTYDAAGNVTAYTGDADKIVIPADYVGSFTELTDKTAVNNVKVLIICNTNVYMPHRAFAEWQSLTAVQFDMGTAACNPFQDHNNKNSQFRGCPSLKYVRLMDNLERDGHTWHTSLSTELFRDCAALENVIFPTQGATVSPNYRAFYNTGVRDFFLPEFIPFVSTNEVYNAPAFSEGIRNVTVYSDTMTYARAAALSYAAVGEELRTNPAASRNDLEQLAKDSIVGAVNAGDIRAGISFGWSDNNVMSMTYRNDTVSMFTEQRTRPEVTMLDGASVRYVAPVGLRFETKIVGLDQLTAEGATWQVGTLIVPTDYLYDSKDFTPEALRTAGHAFLDVRQKAWAHTPTEEEPWHLMRAVIANIQEENYNRAFSARTYVDVTYADGKKARFYSDYSAEGHSRSVYYVSLSALNDTELTLTESQKTVLQTYKAEAEKTPTMYVSWETDKKLMQVVQNYSDTEDFVMVMKPTGINNIFNIAPPKTIANTADTISNQVSSATLMAAMSESDWFGPHIVNEAAAGYPGWGQFTGGTHGSNGNETGDPTGYSDNIVVKVNGEAATGNVTAYATQLEITWDTYVQAHNRTAANMDAYLLVEHHTMRFDGVTWHVETDIEFKLDALWRTHYGMQCVYGPWNSTISYDSGAAKDISGGNASTSSGSMLTEYMLLNEGGDYLEMYLDNSYGIGDRRYVASGNGAFTAAYGSAENGKAYFTLASTTTNGWEVEAGTVASYRGHYRFYNKTDSAEDMARRSIISQGNMTRIANAMKKAQSGEPVTVGVIGGSITQGSSASSTDKTYAQLMRAWWEKNFPDSTLTFINAGKGATDSLMGAHRVQNDLLRYNPDFVVVEFSVNDPDEMVYQESYEGLVRQILADENTPGVLSLMMMNQSGENRADLHQPIAEHYDLPIISYKEAVWPTGGNKVYQWGELSPDSIHPNDTGHTIVADIVTYYLSQVLVQLPTISTEVSAIPQPLTENGYENARLLNHDSITPTATGSFVENDGTYQFGSGWTSNGGTAPITFTLEDAKTVYVLYHVTPSGNPGTATVEVNGSTVGTIDCAFPGGTWQYASTLLVAQVDTADTYSISIFPEAGKTISILGIMVS